MLRLFKRILWVGLLAGSAQAGFGFALLGPINEAYQVSLIGYGLAGDIGAPKNLGEEFRRNTPVMYYTCDANFLDYFGTKGSDAIDAAFAVFNEVFSPANGVDAYTPELYEFPMQASMVNRQAQALYLDDLKSWTMWLIIEQLGLAEPERYTWGLHNRYTLAGGSCPYDQVYSIIKRNFDPAYGTSFDQLKPTSYVNGTLYTYQIPEYCNRTLNPQAWAEPFPVDQTADIYTSVASGGGAIGLGNTFFITYGSYFTGLTRDDVGGLRYLLRSDNMNYENAGADTTTFVKGQVPQLLVTSNLTLFAAQALTNDATALATLYPGLIVLPNSSNFFVNVYTTNSIPYFTNYVWDPVGTLPHLVYATNVTVNIETWYHHTFLNALILSNAPYGWTVVPMPTVPNRYGQAAVTIETRSVGVSNAVWAPVGSTIIATNINYTTYYTNAIVGDLIIMPTNVCQVQLLYPQLTNVISITNALPGATNIVIDSSLGNTNNAGGTNLLAGTILEYTQNQITYFTNHAFVYMPYFCQSSNIALYKGIQKMSFIRRQYDSLLSRFWSPVTNEYTLNMVTNNTVVKQKVQRLVNQPDFLISAADLSSGPSQAPPPGMAISVSRSIQYATNNDAAYPNLAGPGTITGFVNSGIGNAFIFNKVGPIYYNFGLVSTNAFLTEKTQIPLLLWGSYDGTTNAPVVYPNDLSVFELENQVLIAVTPVGLPEATLGGAFSVALEVTPHTPNWDAPTYWSLAPGSPALPPGLTLTTTGSNTALIHGTPTETGFFDFVIRLNDSQGRKTDRGYFIKVNPQF